MRLLPILWRPRRSPYPSPPLPCAARHLQCRLFRLRSPAGLVGRSSELLCPSPAARGWCRRRGKLLVPPAPPFSRSDPPPPPVARFSAPHCCLRPWLSPALVGRSFELMCPLVGCLVCRWRCELSLAGGAAPPSPLMRCIFPTPLLFWQAATPGHLRQAEGYASMGLSLHPATLPLAPALPASHDEPHQCTSVPATCSGAACNKSNQFSGEWGMSPSPAGTK